MHSPEIAQILRLSAMACISIGSMSTTKLHERLQIIETLLSSIYNRGLAEALAAAVGDGLTQGEAIDRAKLLADVASHEARQAMHQIEELCK